MKLSRKIVFLIMAVILAGAAFAVYSHGENSGSNPHATWDRLAENNTPRTVTRGDTPSEKTSGQARIALAIGHTSSRAATCTLARDASLQSHFMLLRLCWHDQRRDETLRLEESLPPPKNIASRNAS